MDWDNHSITLTFIDQAENHKGMQIMNEMAKGILWKRKGKGKGKGKYDLRHAGGCVKYTVV